MRNGKTEAFRRKREPRHGGRSLHAAGLTERTSRRDTRAQLRNGDRKATLEKLANERRQSYEEAHIHVKSGDGAHKEVVDSIVDALEAYLSTRA